MSLHFEAECKYAVVTFCPYRNVVGKPGRVHVSVIGRFRIIGTNTDAAYCANYRDRPERTASANNASGTNKITEHAALCKIRIERPVLYPLCVEMLVDGGQRRDVLKQYITD
jgi:hypothetical protein